MKDRLIELLVKAQFNYYSSHGCNGVNFNEYASDYLIANGVIVPPVKVGDTVYVIEPCTCYNNYSDFEQCHHRRTKATKWIEMVRVPTKHYVKCLKLFERPFKIEYFNKIGKTVFLTREEAEKALQEVNVK